jgi:hypothetical protein
MELIHNFQTNHSIFCSNQSLISVRRTVNDLEKIITEICQASAEYEWDENHISFQLMRKLRELFSNRLIRFQTWSKIVDWHSFKNRGKLEHSYGDIALLVHVQFSSGEMLKGVASLEAKRSFTSGNFESVDLSQLQRLLQNLPYSHLLLYHQTKQTHHIKFPDEATWNTHFWVSPINTSIQLLSQVSVKYNWKLIRASFPFSMFLTSRIFWGLDLDFRDEVYNDLVHGINKTTNPSFLGVVNVYYDRQRLIRPTLADIWEEI